MRITVRLFANLIELLGKDHLVVELPEHATVGDLRQRLLIEEPSLHSHIDRTLVAVNRSYADSIHPLNPEDEVALIPPVGGGSAADPSEDTCRISRDPLDISAAYHLLESVYHGGTVLFCGTVREWTKGRQTSHLTYDAYTEMAIAQMRQIEADVKAQFPTVATLQWHRVGLLYPTDIAVICAASSPHRDDAFQAARILIERLKKEVAIWKKEQYVDGEAKWQPNEQ